MENLDLREILKDVPRGTKLYSPLFGECYLDDVNSKIELLDPKNNKVWLYYNGKYHSTYDGECMLFPSKENRDWSKFELSHKFKIGDVIYNKSYDFISIYKGHNTRFAVVYIPYRKVFNRGINLNSSVNIEEFKYRLATQEEKEKLFDRLQEEGYFWNGETKSLEKYKFKIGDKIQNINDKRIFEITNICQNYYHDTTKAKSIIVLPCSEQMNYELYQEKFDITTFKPYDKVLVRYFNDNVWKPSLFSHLDVGLKNGTHKFATIGTSVPQCIPYEGNEHLIGTTNECDEYYKTW